jgi:prevent-host-death family protein
LKYTVSLTDARTNFTQLTDLVMKEHVTVTVFKRNKPAFKIVPIENEPPQGMENYLAVADDLMDEYTDVTEGLSGSSSPDSLDSGTAFNESFMRPQLELSAFVALT